MSNITQQCQVRLPSLLSGATNLPISFRNIYTSILETRKIFDTVPRFNHQILYGKRGANPYRKSIFDRIHWSCRWLNPRNQMNFHNISYFKDFSKVIIGGRPSEIPWKKSDYFTHFTPISTHRTYFFSIIPGAPSVFTLLHFFQRSWSSFVILHTLKSKCSLAVVPCQIVI